MVTKNKNIIKILFLGTFVFVIGGFLFFSENVSAATGINKQINFQGKVVNNNGTNVSTASYTFLFCIYTTATPATACTSGANGDAVWKESKSITVTDGIFQTSLGDTTAFAALVDFNTDNIYLGINFNANGQMSPLVHFTAAPYALNALKVGGLTVTDTTGTLTIPSGKTIQFADAFTTSGAFPLTLTSIASTTATLPSGTITLADLATGQTLTNKIIGSTGLTFTGAATDITTGTGEDLTLVANGVGVIILNDATTISGTANINVGNTAATAIGNTTGTFSLLSSGGLNVTTGGALTGVASIDTIVHDATHITFAGTGTVASTTTGLTMDSGSGVVSIATGDYLAMAHSGVTSAAAGYIWYDTADGKFKINETTGGTKVLCNTTDAGCGSGGSSTLQTSYDAASGNTILTTTGRNITYTLGEVATPTSFTVESQDTAGVSAERIFNSIASGTLTNGMLVEQTGTGTVTNAISIIETAGVITTGINIGNNVGTGIAIGTGVTTGISIASGGMTITAGALAINNATGITSNQATMIIDAGGTVDVRDIMNADSVTTDTGGVSIANNQSYTGAGIVTLSSATASALTINSGTTGTLAIGDDASDETINIATGAAIKLVTFGSSTTSSNTTIKSGAGGINLVPEGTAEGNVQIGTGGAGSTTPDLLALDVKSDAGDPATAVEGTMYYNTNSNDFRCYKGGTGWGSCGGTGGGGAPGGLVNQIQYNNGASGFAADAGFTFDSTTQTLTLGGTNAEIILNGITTEPSAPAAGDLAVYSKAVAGRMMLKWKAPSGVDTSLQPNLGFNTISLWTPNTGTTGTGGGFGLVWPAATGTITHPTLAITNVGTSLKRMRLANIVTTTNQILGVTASTAALANVWRGNAAGLGGFFFQARFTTELVPAATTRLFVGLTSLITGVVAADTTTGDCAGLSHITTEGITTMAFMTRDNTTTTRATFTVPTIASGNAYDFTMYSPPNGSTIYYRLVNLTDGSTIVDSSTTTTLPRNTIFMGPQVQMSNGTANTVVTTTAIGINKIYLESDN